MTEAEELELLELEAEAAGGGNTTAAGPIASTSETVGRAATQGATAGFADEINAAMQALPAPLRALLPAGPLVNALEGVAEVTSDVPSGLRQGAARVDAEKSARTPLGERFRQVVESYRQGRDADRAGNARAREAHPSAYTATEIASGLPLAFAMPAARGVGSGAAIGAAAGGAGAVGASEADLTKGDLGQALKDALAGAALGGGVGAAAGGLSRLVGRASEGIRKATADAGEMANKSAQQAFRTARSSLGGETTAALQQIAKAEEIAANVAGKYRPDQAAAAAKWLASPEVEAIRQAAADNLLELGPGRIAGSLQSARNVFEGARKGIAPEAVEAAADDLVNHPIRSQVLPRAKNYASRAIPPAVGAAIGGPAGALMGFGAGAVMGNPGTALANMLKHPATRKMGWELLRLLGRASPAVQRGGLPVEQALLADALQENSNVP